MSYRFKEPIKNPVTLDLQLAKDLQAWYDNALVLLYKRVTEPNLDDSTSEQVNHNLTEMEDIIPALVKMLSEEVLDTRTATILATWASPSRTIDGYELATKTEYDSKNPARRADDVFRYQRDKIAALGEHYWTRYEKIMYGIKS